MTARHHIANGLPAQHRPFAITGPIRPNLAQSRPLALFPAEQAPRNSTSGVDQQSDHREGYSEIKVERLSFPVVVASLFQARDEHPHSRGQGQQ